MEILIMKNMKKLIMILLTSALASSCNFLELDPETTLIDRGFYQSPADIRSALYAAYSSLRDNGLYSGSIYLFGDVRSDIAFPNQPNYYANNFRHEIENFSMSSINSANKNYWAHHYRAIIRANTVIDKGGSLFGDDTEVQRYIAEAKVMRALFYFNLVRAYGGVPLVLDVPTEYTDSREHVRASVADVYVRIITDLIDAIESGSLLRSTDNSEKVPTGRVDKYVAEALLGKVFISMPNEVTENAYPNVPAWKNIGEDPAIVALYPGTSTQYEAAKYYLQDVVANGGYSLINFKDLFVPSNKHSSESLWEVEYSGSQTESLGSPFYTAFSPQGYAPRNSANSNGYIPSALSNQGSGNCSPTGYFMDFAKKWDSMFPDYVYEVKTFDGNVYSDHRISNGNTIQESNNSYLPVSDNKDYVQDITHPYDPYTGITFRRSVKGFGADSQWMCGKYMSPSEFKNNDSDDNWYILRYADVLLLLAETEARMADGHISQEILDNTINAVRTRAGVIPYSATGAPGNDWVLDTPEKVYQAIFDERALEFAFEGHRWFDLVRSGKAVETMNEHFSKFYTGYTSNSGSTVDKYYMKDTKYEIDQYCTLFPIPSQEILVNAKLEQNYGAR